MHPRTRDHRRQQLLDRRARHGSKSYASVRDPEYRNDRFGQVTRPAREHVALGDDLSAEVLVTPAPVVRTVASAKLFWSSDHGDPAAVMVPWTERQELIERTDERRIAADRARWGGPRMRSGSIARVA